MSYINGGCDGPSGAVKTKAELKRLVKESPADVQFYGTALMGPQFSGPVEDIPEGVTLSVVGPDPYAKRNWYANIKRGPKGITVS